MSVQWEDLDSVVSWLVEMRERDPSEAERAVIRGRRMYDPMTWAIETAKIRLPKTGPLEFSQHPFLIDPYRDTGNQIVWLKGAQLGFSTAAIIRTLWMAVTFSVSIIYCVDDQTEALTERGWLRQDEITEGDRLLTIDPETRTSRWSPVKEIFRTPYSGRATSIESQTISALTSPGHRWFVRGQRSDRWYWTTSEHLGEHWQMVPTAVRMAEGETQAFSDDFVRFVGWVVTEGSYVHQSADQSSIVITQSERVNPGKTAEIRDLIRRLGIRWAGRRGRPWGDADVPGCHEQTRPNGCVKFYVRGAVPAEVRALLPTKELTPEFVRMLGPRQLDILIDTMLAGDGSRGIFYQRSTKTADSFAMACAMAGLSLTVTRRERPGGFQTWEVRTRKAGTTKLAANQIAHAEWYTGTIWCPRTDDGTFLARRNGKAYWTGNSLPTLGEALDFSKSRIKNIILDSEYLRERTLEVDTIMTKQFAHVPRKVFRQMQRGQAVGMEHMAVSTVYFSGTSSESMATAKDADILVHDEEDKSNPKVIEAYKSRLSGPSKYKWITRLSTPTIPNFGIDKAWKESDQRHWHITCPACNADFELSFPGGPNPWSNITPETFKEVTTERPAQYVCHKCGHVITKQDRLTQGHWVTYEPGAGKSHGWQVSRMAAPWVPAYEMLKKREDAMYPYLFWNFDMAVPWTQSDVQFTREAIMARQDTERPMQPAGDGCYMGVDVGRMFDVVVDEVDQYGNTRTIKMARLPDWASVSNYMRVYNVRTCVIDALPELNATKEWVDSWGRRAWRASYGSGSKKEPGPIWNEETRVVSVDRTSILTKSAEELLSTHRLPRYDGTDVWEAFITHHTNSQKITVFQEGMETAGLIDHYEWVETGPDHMFHARTYAMMARMASRGGGDPIMGVYSTRRSKWTTVTPGSETEFDELEGGAQPTWRPRKRFG
jgi:hypothetical protein